MQDEEISILIEKIKRDIKVPRKPKKMLKEALEFYLEGIKLDKLKLNDRKRRFIRSIYHILDQITVERLKSSFGYSGHPSDISGNRELIADIVLRYYVNNNLEEKILGVSERAGIDKKFLDERYRQGKRIKKEREKLHLLTREPLFYVFLLDKDVTFAK